MTAETDLSDPKSLIRRTVTCVGHKQTQEDFLSGKYGSIFWWGGGRGYIFVCSFSVCSLDVVGIKDDCSSETRESKAGEPTHDDCD